MDEYSSLNHTQWECLYHVVFIPKCRRKTLYVELRKYLAEVFRRLAESRPEAAFPVFVVRTTGIEPVIPCGRQIFIPLRLSPPRPAGRVRGLDCPFAIPVSRLEAPPVQSLHLPPKGLGSGLA